MRIISRAYRWIRQSACSRRRSATELPHSGNAFPVQTQTLSTLVPPHGGDALKALRVPVAGEATDRAHATSLRAVRVSSREKGDLVMLGIGGFTPLEGFMTRADWEGVC